MFSRALKGSNFLRINHLESGKGIMAFKHLKSTFVHGVPLAIHFRLLRSLCHVYFCLSEACVLHIFRRYHNYLLFVCWLKERFEKRWYTHVFVWVYCFRPPLKGTYLQFPQDFGLSLSVSEATSSVSCHLICLLRVFHTFHLLKNPYLKPSLSNLWMCYT